MADAVLFWAPAAVALLIPVAVAWLVRLWRRRPRVWWTVPVAWFVSAPLAVGAILYGLTTVTEALVIWTVSIVASALWFSCAR